MDRLDNNFNSIMNNYFAKSKFNDDENKVDEDVPKGPKNNIGRHTSDGNISTIDELADCIKIILDAAWGENWGTFKPCIEKGDTVDGIKGPIITYDINRREVSENTNIKPQLMDTYKEIVDGKPTGDAIKVYRQWFDCIVEFDIWGRNSLETRKISENFEKIINAYIGNIKKLGISEMFFLNEVPATVSVNYKKDITMRPIMYFVKFERIQTVRTSTIKKIETKVNAFLNKKQKKLL